MSALECPRCGSPDVVARRCNTCRLALDTDAAFEPHTREHTMVRARYKDWTLEKRRASEAQVVRRLLGDERGRNQ